MAFQDTLQQAAWAFMQDWMNRRANEYSAKNQQSWLEGQRGFQTLSHEQNMELQKNMMQQAAMNKFLESSLGLSEMDPAKALNAIGIISALSQAYGKQGIAKGLTSLVPQLQGLLGAAANAYPSFAAGTPQPTPEAIRGMGGVDPMNRIVVPGLEMEKQRRDYPLSLGRLYVSAVEALTPKGVGGAGPNQIPKEFFSLVQETENEMGAYMKKFDPANKNSSESVAIMMEVMKGMNPNWAASTGQGKDQENWIMKTGPEFFSTVHGMIKTLRTMMTSPTRGYQPTVMDEELINAAGDPVNFAREFMAMVPAVAEFEARKRVGDPATIQDPVRRMEVEKKVQEAVSLIMKRYSDEPTFRSEMIKKIVHMLIYSKLNAGQGGAVQ